MKFYKKSDRPMTGSNRRLRTTKKSTAQQRERNSVVTHTHPIHKKKHRAAARAKFYFEFWITMCSVNSPKPLRMAHFSKNGAGHNEPKKKNAPRRGHSADTTPRGSIG